MTVSIVALSSEGFMLSVTNKSVTLRIVMLSVIMLSAMAPATTVNMTVNINSIDIVSAVTNSL